MKFYFSLLVCVVLVSSCSHSTDTANSSTPTQHTSDTLFLLSHSRFEKNGSPSLNGWTFHPAQADDTLDFEADAPPTGGTWSFKLHTSDTLATTNYVTQTFTNLTSGVYKLTAWTKMKYSLPVGSYPLGWISITKVHASTPTLRQLWSPDSSTWNLSTLYDTLNLVSSDTVTVMLSAGARRANDFTLHGNPMWIDDITFAKLP